MADCQIRHERAVIWVRQLAQSGVRWAACDTHNMAALLLLYLGEVFLLLVKSEVLNKK
jgi:hypothetical protein